MAPTIAQDEVTTAELTTVRLTDSTKQTSVEAPKVTSTTRVQSTTVPVATTQSKTEKSTTPETTYKTTRITPDTVSTVETEKPSTSTVKKQRDYCVIRKTNSGYHMEC